MKVYIVEECEYHERGYLRVVAMTKEGAIRWINDNYPGCRRTEFEGIWNDRCRRPDGSWVTHHEFEIHVVDLVSHETTMGPD